MVLMGSPLHTARSSSTAPPGKAVHFLRDPLNWVAVSVFAVWACVGIWLRPIGDYGVGTDFYGDFAPNARLWMQGEPGLMNGFRGPVYYLLLGVGSLLFEAFAFAKLLSALCAGISVRLVGGLLRRFWTPIWGFAGALFLAGNAVFIAFTYQACTDHVYFALFAATLVLLFRPDDTSPKTWLWAGALAALAYLTRYNGFALLPIGVVTALTTVRPLKRGAVAAGLFLGMWLVVVSPWWVYLWQKTGNPFWNRTFVLVAEGIYARNPVEANNLNLAGSVGFESLLDVVRLDSGRVFGAMASNLWQHAWFDVQRLVHPVWAALGVLGLVLNWRSCRDRSAGVFAASGVIAYLVLLPVFYNPRFMMTLLIWWAACFGGLVHVMIDAARRRRRPGAVAIGLVCLGIATVWATARGVQGAWEPGAGPRVPHEILRLAEKVEGTGHVFDASTPICARKPHIGYYLGAPTDRTHLALSPRALAETGMHYLFVSGAEVAQYPTMMPLLRTAAAGRSEPGLDLVSYAGHVDRDGIERACALFAVRDSKPWTLPDRDRIPAVQVPPPGLERIDFLRTNLARWYLMHALDGPVMPLFDLVSPQARAHALVRLTESDALIVANDLAAAERIIGEELATSPERSELLLRLALIRSLAGDRPGFERHVIEYARLLGIDPRRDMGTLVEAAVAYDERKDHCAATPLFLFAYAHVSEGSNAVLLKRLGYGYLNIRRYDLAVMAFRRYLERVPEDVAVRITLERDFRLNPAARPD